MKNIICFVLKPGVGREEVAAAARKVGLVLASQLEGDDFQRLSYEEAWTSANDLASMNYIESQLLNVSYLVFRGEKAPIIIDQILAILPAYTHPEVLDLARQAGTRNDQVRGLYRLAVMFPNFQQDAFDIFAAFATQAQTALLREAAVDAMAYRAWPQFIPLLEKILASDVADNVRQRAEDVLKHVRAVDQMD